MTKKDKIKKKDVDYSSNVEVANIADTCKSYMQIYGANNNLMRHLPDVYDGLKIGERRILYSMYKSGLKYNGPTMKVKNIVGNTMGLYHPHGDAAIEATLVKLAQPWMNTQKFIDGKGNFGSAAGDCAANGRYTEARLSFYAYKCFFEEYTPESVNLTLNYLGKEYIPEYLPAKYPNVLISNTFGIGWGIATGIPTYNFKEVCNATIDLIENPNLEDIVLVPDAPSGAYIVDEGQFPELCRTGKGTIKMRGVMKVNEEDNSIMVYSTPMMTSWNKLKKNIIPLLNDGKNNILKDIRDLSDKGTNGQMRFKLILKKEADPITAMHKIYKKTEMEKTFPIQFKLIENYTDTDYSLKAIIQTWIDFRRETKRRIYANKFSSGKERLHILDILLLILNKDNAEKTIKIFKKSENTKACAETLMKTYGISSLQAATIADMKFSALTKEAYKRYIAEKEKLEKEVNEVEKIIRSAKKIDKIIIDELKEGIELFGEDRRSEIINIDNEVKVRNTKHMLVFTEQGNVKKLPDEIKTIGSLANDDRPINIMHVMNTMELMVFDDRGKVSRLEVKDIPNSTINSNGFKLSDYCKVSGNVISIKAKPTDELDKLSLKKSLYYIMISKNGLIKKTKVDAFVNMKTDLTAMIIKDDDKMVCCKMMIDDADIVVYSKKGVGLRFNSSDITETSRMSMGVGAMQLDDDDELIGMDIISPKDKYIFVVTSKGYAKKSTLDTFECKARYSKPIRIVTVDDDDSIKTIRTVHGDEKFRVFKINSEPMDINVSDDIIELPRLSKGKKAIPVKRGDGIIDIRLI